MTSWTGIALALAEPGSDRLGSRLSTYLHPLAGRPLAWHTLHALAALRPAPERLVLVAGPELASDLFADLPVAVHVVPREAADLPAAVHAAGVSADFPVLAVDAAAPALGEALDRLVAGPVGIVLADAEGIALAAWLTGPEACALLRAGGGLEALPAVGPELRCRAEPAAFAVRSRAELARASRHVRDRLVRALMEGGTTFLLPESVLVDVDVRTGRDTVVYPGVVLEGRTVIGDETVVGPGCRIIESWIGTGVELKGWNDLSHTTVRNRAIVEPHVRR
ncbi:MAG TPA: hypothetical protein VFX98_06845, partial [Longimicrobiaceae bacterium]|nr:hypothetical protein [Longimicrobiaceae bacterium]